MMSPFEYVTVLISIILGMGLTQLISGFAAIITRWEKVTIYWPHMALILLVFVIHVQDWWATYELRAFKYWRLPTFLFIVLYPVNLYVLTRILFPVKWTGSKIDLKEFYLSNYRKIYLFMILLPIHSILDNHFIGGYALKDQLLQFCILVILLVVLILNRREGWIHQIMAAIFIFIMIATFAVEWNRLLIA